MKKTLGLFLILFMFGCATSPQKQGEVTDKGLWSGKVQMTNKTTKQRKWVNVVWASDSAQDRMRIDVSAMLDVPIATYLKNDEGSHLWVFTENKYYFSKDSEKLFKHLTKLSINPNIFYSMLGKPKAPSSLWSCSDKSAVFKCHSEAEKTRFLVKHDDNNKRIIKIEKGFKALQIRLSRSKVQVKDKLFKSLDTSQFKTIQI